jgi:very-short-patch-repair endonuclease
MARIAERQHGVISIGQLRMAGVSEDAVRGRVLAGRLHRVHRGVYTVGHRAISLEGELMAAVLAYGGSAVVDAELASASGGDSRMAVLDRWGAAVSHRSSAVLWGLLAARAGPVDVSVRGDSGRRRRRGIRLHRSLSLLPADVTLHCGIPVTTPTRTIADLKRAEGRSRAVSGREVRRAIRQASVLGLPIGDEIGRDRTRSDLERDFLRLCRRHGLPKPEVNVRVGVDLVDFLWRCRRLIVETDSYIYHRGRQAFQDDRERDLRLRAAGYDIVRVSEKQADEEPELVAETVVAALRVGADGDQGP